MKAVFLDRDGTVIIDSPDERVDSFEKIAILPHTLEALNELAKLEFKIFFVTNQAGIAEGRINEKEFEDINQKVIEMLEPSGIKILKTYVCPHGSDDSCQCHKPKPKLLLDAAKEFDIDLANSWLIGDRQSDILAGVNAGTKTILVRTGNVAATSADADYTVADLLEAVRCIARQE